MGGTVRAVWRFPRLGYTKRKRNPFLNRIQSFLAYLYAFYWTGFLSSENKFCVIKTEGRAVSGCLLTTEIDHLLHEIFKDQVAQPHMERNARRVPMCCPSCACVFGKERHLSSLLISWQTWQETTIGPWGWWEVGEVEGGRSLDHWRQPKIGKKQTLHFI